MCGRSGACAASTGKGRSADVHRRRRVLYGEPSVPPLRAATGTLHFDSAGKASATPHAQAACAWTRRAAAG
jgi:hypothetical protein